MNLINSALLLLGMAACTSCQASKATPFIVGGCAFSLEDSKEWKVSGLSDDRAVITYKYGSERKREANLNIRCEDSDYEAIVAENFSSPNDKTRSFTTGSGESVTTAFKGVNWEGLQTEYYQGTACYNVIGKANESHAFSVDICDQEKALQEQLPIIAKLLHTIRVGRNGE